MKTVILTICVLIAGGIGLARGDMITNPGFEDTNADTSFGDSWGSYGNVAFMDFFPNGNPGHATFFADNAANSGGFFQQGILATVGNEYRFSIDAAFESNWSATTEFGLEFYQSDDATLVSSTLVGIFKPAFTSYDTYAMQATAPVGAVYVRPIVKYGTVTDVQGFNEAATFDNASLTVVPEPSVGLLLLGGAGLLGLIRRRLPVARG